MQEELQVLSSVLFMTVLSVHPRDFDTLPQNIYCRWRLTDWLITWQLIRLPIQIGVSISVVARGGGRQALTALSLHLGLNRIRRMLSSLICNRFNEGSIILYSMCAQACVTTKRGSPTVCSHMRRTAFVFWTIHTRRSRRIGAAS